MSVADEELIDRLQADNLALRDQLAEIHERHASALEKLRAEHAKHLAAIEHGDCVSTKHHKAALAEIMRRSA